MCGVGWVGRAALLDSANRKRQGGVINSVHDTLSPAQLRGFFCVRARGVLDCALGLLRQK